MFLRSLFRLSLVSAIAGSCSSIAAPQSPKTLGTADNIVMLPAGAILAVEKDDKGLALLTDTGRFIIQGTLYDVWAQKELKTLEDVRHATQYVPVDKAHFGFQDLEPLQIGQGDKVITMFADPACGYCKDIMQEARNSLPEGYRLDVLMLPILSPISAKRTQELHCAQDPSAAWQAAVAGDIKTPLDQKPTEACSLEVIAKRRLTAQFLGARNVPYLIRDDGLTREGKPSEGLRAWIEQRTQAMK